MESDRPDTNNNSHQSNSPLLTKIGIVTAVLVALTGFTDAGIALIKRLKSIPCEMGISLSWCPGVNGRDENKDEVKIREKLREALKELEEANK